MFLATPPAGPVPRRDLGLMRASRRVFTGSTGFLDDPGNRARTTEYLSDLARAYGHEVPSFVEGQSYGEMAQALIGELVPADEPVDLLVLAFSVPDLRPGRQAAAFLSHVTPGAPTAFAVCDQGSAAAFSALRIAQAYASSAGIGRALLIVVEQAGIPYAGPVPVPSGHRAVALLCGGSGTAQARVTAVRQCPAVAPEEVAHRAAAEVTDLASGDTGLVLGHALAARWNPPEDRRVRVVPPGSPTVGVWWGLIDELTIGPPDRLVLADYDADLGYLSLAALNPP